MLEIKHLTKTFNPHTINEHRVIDDLSLKVEDGDFITIIGSNGSGKSTLFNLIAGSLIADSGSIILNGQDITLQKEHLRAHQIGRLFQDPLTGTAAHMTVEENLALAAKSGGWLKLISQADRQMFTRQLAQLEMGLENCLDQPVGLLSGGQRQALTLMMATINPPQLLLLDEHTAALDPASADKVLEITNRIVAQQKLTCLMITHNMASALQLGNRTIMMDKGRIILDLNRQQKKEMSVEQLVEQFHRKTERIFSDDEMMLAQQYARI